MSAPAYNTDSLQHLAVLGLGVAVQPFETLPERLAVIKRMGYDYVYFGDLFHEATDDHMKSRGGFDAVRRAIADAGMKIDSSHYVLMYPGPDDTFERIRERHLRGLDIGAETGLSHMTTHYVSVTNVEKPGYVDAATYAAYAHNPIKGSPALWGAVMRNLGGEEVFLEKNNDMYRWFCEEALKRRITVTIETAICHLTRTPAQIIEIIKKIGSPNLGICLDSGHSHIASGDVPGAVRQAGDYLKETHFHDNFGDLDLHRPIGIGTINWVEVIQALHEIDFPGPVTFETNGAPHCTWEEEAVLYAQNWREFLKTTAYDEARHKAFTGQVTW